MLRIVCTTDGVLETLDRTKVLHDYDVVEPTQNYQIIQNKGTPKYIINDHYSYLDIDFDGHYCLPLFAEITAQRYQKFPEIQATPNTVYAFNFMINKKQINRHMCMKFVELFGLGNYDHTWSGIGGDYDMSDIILELDRLKDNCPVSTQERSKLLGPVTKIDPKFFICSIQDT
jgi:hypothetical protein